ncbi:hypothetical protein N7481_006735 [Penicillium waksmanii]|uniref:uncharacterized protein n=1 Tax=Penicillium waksmanii TaxID=69791 RepID=UPI00254836D1|nr:uncharacterized protein N7481_006735 [Penicillium waksmanii]KAJ5984636.1 hypothetical protein N7481_006735 [Penicillium waksmanii]
MRRSIKQVPARLRILLVPRHLHQRIGLLSIPCQIGLALTHSHYRFGDAATHRLMLQVLALELAPQYRAGILPDTHLLILVLNTVVFTRSMSANLLVFKIISGEHYDTKDEHIAPDSPCPAWLASGQ